jgi:hypothetical protein
MRLQGNPARGGKNRKDGSGNIHRNLIEKKN